MQTHRWYIIGLNLGLAIAAAQGMESDVQAPLLGNHTEEEAKSATEERRLASFRKNLQQIVIEARNHDTPLEPFVAHSKQEFTKFLATLAIFDQHPQLKKSYVDQGNLLFSSVKIRNLTPEVFHEEYYRLCQRVTQASTDLYHEAAKIKEQQARQKEAGCQYVCLCTIL